jgi:hypothetical protein
MWIVEPDWRALREAGEHGAGVRRNQGSRRGDDVKRYAVAMPDPEALSLYYQALSATS